MPTKYEMSPEARKILDFLKLMEPKARVSYDVLRNLTGINDLARLRARFYTAAKRAFSLWQMRFGCERGVGYVRLDEGGKNTEVSKGITKVRRSIKRSTRYHNAVEFTKLDDLGKLENAVNSAQLQEMRHATSRKRRNALAQKQATTVLPGNVAGPTVEMFRRKRT
jgi:hypothetical protein